MLFKEDKPSMGHHHHASTISGNLFIPFPSVASSVRSLSLLACWAHEPIQVLYVYSRVLTATERSTILYSPAMAGVAI